jgi:hypothetical protein
MCEDVDDIPIPSLGAFNCSSHALGSGLTSYGSKLHDLRVFVLCFFSQFFNHFWGWF